jgi:hypothetical protein
LCVDLAAKGQIAARGGIQPGQGQHAAGRAQRAGLCSQAGGGLFSLFPQFGIFSAKPSLAPLVHIASDRPWTSVARYFKVIKGHCTSPPNIP